MPEINVTIVAQINCGPYGREITEWEEYKSLNEALLQLSRRTEREGFEWKKRVSGRIARTLEEKGCDGVYIMTLVIPEQECSGHNRLHL